MYFSTVFHCHLHIHKLTYLLFHLFSKLVFTFSVHIFYFQLIVLFIYLIIPYFRYSLIYITICLILCSIHICLYLTMFISYYVYIDCRGRVKTNVVRTCDPTPLLYIFWQ